MGGGASPEIEGSGSIPLALHDFLFLSRQGFIDLAVVFVGQLLYVLGDGALLVLGTISILLLALQYVSDVPPDLREGQGPLSGQFSGPFLPPLGEDPGWEQACQCGLPTGGHV